MKYNGDMERGECLGNSKKVKDIDKEYKQAMEIVAKTLREDPEMYKSWLLNIKNSVVDRLDLYNDNITADIETGIKDFLNTLIKE